MKAGQHHFWPSSFIYLNLCFGIHQVSFNSKPLLMIFILDFTTTFWIRASDQEEEGNWKWQGGTSVTMGTPFWSYYPENPVIQHPTNNIKYNCACIRSHVFYYLMECNCSHDFAPLCYTQPK